jgi:hypothetical protein
MGNNVPASAAVAVSLSWQRVFERRELACGRRLLLRRSGRLLAVIEPDDEYPGLYRVHLVDGHITDFVNYTRAKDAAEALVIEMLKHDG